MNHIAIISSSVREGRKSHNVAQYFLNYLKNNNLATAEILDLKEYNFPLFDERLSKQKNPQTNTIDFANKIKNADGIIIVTPEYNGSIPASLKNIIDLLYEQWHRKPIAISTVSSGNFAGLQALVHLQFIFWKVRAWTFTANFPVPEVQNKFDDNGIPLQQSETDGRAKVFLNELFNCIDSSKK